MMMFWAWAGVPLGVYNIVQDFNIALRVQPQMLAFLSLTTWIQCYYYEQVRVAHLWSSRSVQSRKKLTSFCYRNGRSHEH